MFLFIVATRSRLLWKIIITVLLQWATWNPMQWDVIVPDIYRNCLTVAGVAFVRVQSTVLKL